MKKALAICGRTSGRDTDKEKEAITLTRYDYDVDEENAVFVVYKLSNSPG